MLDGAPIFEKSKIGRHAKAGEIMTIVQSRVGSVENG
jgi:hypothetical protein